MENKEKPQDAISYIAYILCSIFTALSSFSGKAAKSEDLTDVERN